MTITSIACAAPTWVSPLIGVIVGFLLNLFYQYIREVRSRPVLKIDCDAAGRRIGEDPDNVWMKLRVRNQRRRSVAKNCRVYIIGIHEVRGNRKMPDDLLPDSAQLFWEGGDVEPRDIPHGHSQYADIVHFSKHEPGWNFTLKPNFIEQNGKIRIHRGTFQVAIVATGDGAQPDWRNINIDYDGDWHNARPYEA
jgi:hypothetical protein